MKLYRKSILGEAVTAYKVASNGDQASTRSRAARPSQTLQAGASDRFFERLVRSSADLARESDIAKE